MKYVNREMKIDQLIGYFNSGKINLIPPFQRGSVWSLRLRQALIRNMLKARPIPAIFLYKQAEGAQFSYKILDGKQRLETLLLFVADRRSDLKVDRVEDYFLHGRAKKDLRFKVELDGTSVSFADLDASIVRSFREYSIPAIEIDLDDESASIEDIVSLFVDINQLGVKVTRFDVIKALGKGRLLQQALDLVATRQTRARSLFYKIKHRSAFVFVLKHLNAIARLKDNNARVDRMWERLAELAFFIKTGTHWSPVQVIDAFIRKNERASAGMTKGDMRRLRDVFEAIQHAYRADGGIAVGKIATDQAVFYTLVTTLLSEEHADEIADRNRFVKKLSTISDALAGKKTTLPRSVVGRFTELLQQGTADPSKRRDRGSLLQQMLSQA